MATSGSEDYSQSALQIITQAHRLAGVTGIAETLDNAELTQGLVTANLMVKDWAADGVRLHTYKDDTLTLVADTASYTFGTGGDFTTFKPLKILSARHVISGIETPMEMISKDEYNRLPDKTSSGPPSLLYYDPRGGATALGIAYTWPVDTAANTIKFTAQRVIEDLDAGANDWDFPPEWLLTITYNLAVLLSDIYGSTLMPNVEPRAVELYERLKGYSREDPGHASIVPLCEDY